MTIQIFIFGTGMYVTGRGTSGLGTIFPALVQYARDKPQYQLEVIFFATTQGSADICESYLSAIEKKAKDVFCRINVEVVVGVADHQITDIVTRKQQGLSLAIVAVPDRMHYPLINICADLGLHVLTVKPFVETVEQARSLIKKFKDMLKLG